MTIYLASYKATQPGWKGLVNRGIRWATKSEYSHSEICIGNPLESTVDCLSSVGVEGGVRIKTMRLSADKWDVVPLPGVTVNDVAGFYVANVGKKYDMIGCIRTMLPWVGKEHPDHFFCSEVVSTIIGHQEPWRMYPGVLHQVVTGTKIKAQENLVA